MLAGQPKGQSGTWPREVSSKLLMTDIRTSWGDQFNRSDDKWWQTTITRGRQLKCEHLYAFKDLNLLGGACEQKLTNT